MTKEEISIKYRVICPNCHKAFDIRRGYNYNGHLICWNCMSKLDFATMLGYIQNETEGGEK